MLSAATAGYHIFTRRTGVYVLLIGVIGRCTTWAPGTSRRSSAASISCATCSRRAGSTLYARLLYCTCTVHLHSTVRVVSTCEAFHKSSRLSMLTSIRGSWVHAARAHKSSRVTEVLTLGEFGAANYFGCNLLRDRESRRTRITSRLAFGENITISRTYSHS